MKIKHSKKLLLLLAIVGIVVGSQGVALADSSSDWWQSLFGGQQDSNSNPPDEKQKQVDQNNALQYQQVTIQDDQILRQDYQKLRQDQRAGVDTSADQQAIQNQIQALKVDQGRNQAVAQDLAKDGIPNTYTAPAGYTNPGYGRPDGRWDNRDAHPGDRRWENRRRNDYYNTNGYPQPDQGNNYRHHRYDPNWVNNQ